MSLTQEQLEELHRMAKPLRVFLRDHCHPHCRLIVEQETVELVETVSRTMDQPTPTDATEANLKEWTAAGALAELLEDVENAR